MCCDIIPLRTTRLIENQGVKMKPFSRNGLRTALALIAVPMLLGGGWFGYIAHLTALESRACLEETNSMRQCSDIPYTARLQHVLDEYSASNDNVGLQATIVFADGST
jgi:hypothetical protein